MPLSDAERSRRYRKKHPDKIRADNKAAWESGRKKAWRKTRDPNKEREYRQERHFRLGARSAIGHCGTTITTLDMQQPRFLWIDKHGQLHIEDWQTPEQLLTELRKEGKL
jgi:hypothetical protein